MPTGIIIILLFLFIIVIVAAIWIATIYPIGASTKKEKGVYKVFNTDLCQQLPTCFGQNPATPYARPVFLNQDNPLDMGTILGAMEMGTNQAVVIYGKRPPTSKYFGFTPYLYDRLVNGNPDQREVLYASLTDTTNNYTIPETATKLAVIWTRNKYIMDDLTSQYQSQGYYVIPLIVPDVLIPGDRVAMLTRVTYFASEEAKERYIHNPGMETYRITYSENVKYIPYCINLGDILDPNCITLKPRAALPTEDDLTSQFEQYVNESIASYEVIDQFPFNDYLGGINSGYDCIAAHENCRADNRDASYKTSPKIIIDENTLIVVYGVNHQLFNKAIYSSIDVYNLSNEYGFGNFLAKGTDKFYNITIGYSEMNTIIVPTTYTDLVLAERVYAQQPENIAPSYRSVISPVAYLVKVNNQS